MSETIGSRDCDSSAPPVGMITFPVSGSVKVPLARPSQKSWGKYAAAIMLGELRPVA